MKEIILFLLFTTISFAQIQGKVIDEKNNPIAYVNIWVENEETGTTSETDGNFSIAVSDTNKNLIFTALGFETKKVKASSVQKVILKEAIIKLEEVNIINKIKKKEIEIGDYKSNGIRFHHLSSFKYPVILAKFIPFNKEMLDCNYLKSVQFYSTNKIDKAKVNIQILEANNDGTPGPNLYNENIIVEIKKGNHNTNVNIEKYNLKMPENGIFIVLETLIIQENKHVETLVYTEDKKKHKTIRETYQPNFGFLPSKKAESWKKSGEQWKQLNEKQIIQNPDDLSNFLMKKYHDNYLEFPIKLVLTN